MFFSQRPAGHSLYICYTSVSLVCAMRFSPITQHCREVTYFLPLISLVGELSVGIALYKSRYIRSIMVVMFLISASIASLANRLPESHFTKSAFEWIAYIQLIGSNLALPFRRQTIKLTKFASFYQILLTSLAQHNK